MPSPPNSPFVRYRLRTLVWITTVMAVLASIAGPFYRAQTPLARKALMIYWCSASVATLAMIAVQWRRHTTIPKQLGEPHVPCLRASLHGRNCIFHKLVILPMLAFVAVHSFDAVKDAKRAAAASPPRGVEITPLLARGLICGCLLGSTTMLIVSIPAAICSHGISLPLKPIRWSQVRSASWLKYRKNIMKIVFESMPMKLEEAFLYISPKERDMAEAILKENLVWRAPPSDDKENSPRSLTGG